MAHRREVAPEVPVFAAAMASAICIEKCANAHEKETRISDPRTNDRIRVPEVRLVGPNGEQVGVVRIEDAIRLAQEADLDLVEVAPNSKPPVAKIMDYGKFKYEEAQKAKEARRNQANTILKEVRFRLKIDTHDYETKRKRAEGFLSAGDKVKAMILFRGREQSRPEQGVRLLQRFAEDVSEFGSIESTPMIDGRNMVMVIGPHKTKAAAKAEADARKAANKPVRAQVAQPAVQAKTAVEKPTATEAVVEKPVVEKPAVAKPVVEKPVVAKPVTEKPLTEKPPTEETPAQKTPAQKPVAVKPVADKPTVEKATTTKAAAAPKPATPKPATPASPARVTASKTATTKTEE